MAAQPCPLLGDGVTDDALLHIARFLPADRNLLRLQPTHTRFCAKVIAAPSGGGAEASPAAIAPDAPDPPQLIAMRAVAEIVRAKAAFVGGPVAQGATSSIEELMTLLREFTASVEPHISNLPPQIVLWMKDGLLSVGWLL
jgi:hypothetical protein